MTYRLVFGAVWRGQRAIAGHGDDGDAQVDAMHVRVEEAEECQQRDHVPAQQHSPPPTGIRLRHDATVR